MSQSSASSPAAASPSLSAEQVRSREVRNRWLLASPALFLIFIGALAPLAVMLVYSFLKAGDYGGVVWQLSWEGWFNVFMQRDIFSEELTFVDAHLWIFGRSITLSLLTTISALILGLPTAYFIATRPPASRNFWLFLITIPFWTNLLIRTFAIMELIRAQGTINTVLTWVGADRSAARHAVHQLRHHAGHDLRLSAADGAADLCLDGEV
jgi:spermidine/putrescine transport system permease protein